MPEHDVDSPAALLVPPLSPAAAQGTADGDLGADRLATASEPDEELYRRLLDAIDVGFCVIEILFDEEGNPNDYRFLSYNRGFVRHTGLSGVIGKTIREVVPDIDDFWARTYGGVALTGEAVHFENHAPAMNRWFSVDAVRIGGASDRKVGVLFTDITMRKEAEEALQKAEERERRRLTDIFMRAPAFMAALRGPDHVFELANEPYYRLIGRQHEFVSQSIIGRAVQEVLPEVVGQGFIGLLDHVYRTGEAFTGSDTRVVFQLDADTSDERFVDFNFQPLFDEDGAVSGILVHGVDLTERKRLERERERMLSEAHARAEREALLNKIGAGVRTTLEPEAILKAVVSELGRGLQADRCYFVRYDQAHDSAVVSPEWFRKEAGVEPLSGRTFKMSNYSVDRDAAYKAGRTHVVHDVVAYAPDNAEPLVALHLRSMLRVPIEAGNEMQSLTVAMAREPRHWAPDEVQLVENVAALVRSTLEAAQVQQRERRIARQLEAALMPPSPPQLPGLALASFYRPALQEAGVGGDFFDVFSVEKGCTALVVADLSGKGLAAAQQVATVKNMLRLALYTGRTVADAVITLHNALVEHDLLTGFATLFVGMYDQAQSSLTFVNCGQEPGLLWRAATGAVEELAPTGPVLGGFGPGRFEQRTVDLAHGDVLALFTDGLTEVGPNRKDFLEIEGVTRVLKQACAGTDYLGDPHVVVGRVVAAVDAFGQGGVRDDVALLVGVAGSGAGMTAADDAPAGGVKLSQETAIN